MNRKKVDLKSIQLNYRELDYYIKLIKPRVEGQVLERLYVPKRPAYPSGFLKNEFCLRFSATQTPQLLIRIQPGQTYFCFFSGKRLQAQLGSTQSPFFMKANSTLKGRRLESIEPLSNERAVVLQFSGGAYLVMFLFPAHPMAFLSLQTISEQTLSYELSSKNEGPSKVHLPSGKNAPKDLKLEPQRFDSLEGYFEQLQTFHLQQAIAIRLQRLQRLLKNQVTRARKKITTYQKGLDQIKHQPDFSEIGHFLEANRHHLAASRVDQDHQLVIHDEITNKIRRIPILKGVSLSKLPGAYFDRAKERQVKKKQLEQWVSEARKALKQSLFDLEQEVFNLEELEALEKRVGISHEKIDAKTEKRLKNHPGKRYLSKEGLNLFVGRNRKENQELTFKFAHGNDLWLHVRGRPSAHVIVSIPRGKSASLETLLDAAHLVLHYSKGKHWGKTEIDYTFKKNVRRIKKTNEVSYSQANTLLVEFDSDRMNRILGS